MKKGSIKPVILQSIGPMGFNLIIGVIALTLDAIGIVPRLPISQTTGIITGALLLIIHLGIARWAALSLPTSEKRQDLVTKGAYTATRHPVYASIMLLFNSGLILFFRSTSLVIGLLLIWTIWLLFIRIEEKLLKKRFGEAYTAYTETTPMLLPTPKSLRKALQKQ